MTRPRTLVAAVAAASLTIGVLAVGSTASAAPPSSSPPPTPVVTRAALAPELVGAGRPRAFLEQEAENATTNGTVIGGGRDAYTIEAEASGRKAVRLAPVSMSSSSCPQRRMRSRCATASRMPQTGGGLTAPLAVTTGSQTSTLTMTSQFAYLYNQYPFSNDPSAGLLHRDWWLTECGCVPQFDQPDFEPATPFRPMKFYDEERLLLAKTYKAGEVIRLTAPAGVAWTVIDLIDTELVGHRRQEPGAVNVLLRRRPQGPGRLGPGDRGGHRRRAGRRAARSTSRRAPFRVDRHIVVDDITITGAGHWYTKIKGSEVTLAEPAADGSVHTGVGFYGKDAAEGGSHDVHLSGFAIEGDVRERIDTDQVNAIGGAFHRLVLHGPAHPAHQGGPVVRRADVECPRRAERHRRPDRRCAELPYRSHGLGRARQLRAQQRRRRTRDVGGVPREHVPTNAATCSITTPCRRRRSRTASRSTAAPTPRSRTTSWRTRSARAARCTPDRGSELTRSTAAPSRTTRPRARERSS